MFKELLKIVLEVSRVSRVRDLVRESSRNLLEEFEDPSDLFSTLPFFSQSLPERPHPLLLRYLRHAPL